MTVIDQKWPKVGSKARRDGHGDGVRSARIRVHITLQVPAGIELNPDIGYPRFVENPAPKHALDRSLRPELRVHHQCYRPMFVRQGRGGKQHRARCLNTLLDFRIAVIGHKKSKERTQPQAMNGGHPIESGPQMRPIVPKIAGEERGYEKRNDGRRLMKARQLRCQAKVGLVIGITEHGNVRTLQSQ